MRILIVCSGNTCRSPMAEVMLREELDRAGITGIEVQSAGIVSPGGEAMSPYSAEALIRGGYRSFTEFRSSAIDRLPLSDFDWILCMTKSQMLVMNHRFSGISERTRTLALTAAGLPADIADPFGGPMESYLETFEEIHDAVVKLVVELKEEKEKGAYIMKIGLGSDHGGFELKKTILDHLAEKGIVCEDFGTYTKDSCDYPDYGYKVAEAVVSGACDLGILVCGTGIGISLAANKVDGIRCAVVSDTFSAEMSRAHNNANVLALGERVVGKGLALKIVDTWLATEFEGGRHQLRVDKIMAIEKKR